MIVQARNLQEVNYRTDYGIQAFQDLLGHLVVRRTTPDNPFVNKPHAGARSDVAASIVKGADATLAVAWA